MNERSDYWDWAGLGEVYLEDSFVLDIEESAGELRFRMEIVLREGHPAFKDPPALEQYCFAPGTLVFHGTKDILWSERNEVKSVDAAGESDLGNIDQLYLEEGRYHLKGDWGVVMLSAEAVELLLEA